jgi:general secretion pathway protein D
MTSFRKALCIALAALLLAGCAAEQSYKRGEELLQADHPEEALAAYQAALAAEPTSARYRIAYLTAREQSVTRFITEADKARREGRVSEAHDLYERLLRIDPNNGRATAGIAELEAADSRARLIASAQDDARHGSLDRALGTLREVLARDPRNAAALALRAKLEQAQEQPRVGIERKLAQAYRKPVSLEFRDAQLKNVLEVLSRSSGLNFVLDKDVRGDQRTSIFLRNSTVADALSMVLLTNQLAQRVLDGNSVLIFPNNPAKLRQYQPLVVKSFVLSSADAKTVANSLKTILKTKDMVVDDKANMIIIRDTPEAVRMAERIVALHDQPEAEVMMDVEILEVKRAKLRQLGVQYPASVALAPLASASGVQLTLNDLKHLSAATTGVTLGGIGVQANDTLSDVNVLASPRIRARNHEKAKIQVGQRVPNITSTSTSTGFVSETVQYVDVGLKVEVQPDISPDGEVAMKVDMEVSNILSQIQTKAGSVAYEIGTRNADTVLRLHDGENEILAGLIQDQDSRSNNSLPGLGSIPGLGGTLFGSTNDDAEKSEIVLSITPHIIRPAYRPDLQAGEFDSGTEDDLGSSVLLAGTGGGADAASTPAAPTPAAAAASSPTTTDAVPAATSPAGDAPASGRAAGSDGADKGAPQGSGAAPLVANDTAPGGPSELSWRGPASVPAGSTFTVELWAAVAQPLSVIPVTVSYDPKVLSVVSVADGSLMGNAGIASTLSKRVDAAGGTVRAVINAAAGASRASAAAAQGSLLRLQFKALAASAGTSIAVADAVKAVSATGESVTLESAQDWRVQVR